MIMVRLREPLDGPYYARLAKTNGFLYTLVDDHTYNPLTSPNFVVIRSLATGEERVAHRDALEFEEDAPEAPTP